MDKNFEIYSFFSHISKINIKYTTYRKFHNILKKIPKGNVLEIGCSTGDFLEVLKKEGWNVKGIDISRKSVKLASKKGIKVMLHDTNEKFTFEDNSFDVIIAGEIIEHQLNDLNFLNECHRILKNKGTLIFSTPNLVSLKNRVLMLFGFEPRYAVADFHYQIYTKRLLKNLLEKSSFNKYDLFGDYIIYSKNREVFFGTILEKLGDFYPSFSEHLICVAKK